MLGRMKPMLVSAFLAASVIGVAYLLVSVILPVLTSLTHSLAALPH